VWLQRDGCKEGQPHSCFCGLGFLFSPLALCSKNSFVILSSVLSFTINANGLLSMFFYQYEDYHPRISNSFNRMINYFELALMVELGFTQKMSKHIHFNFKIPVNIYQIRFKNKYIEDPRLPEKLRSITTIGNEFFKPRFFILLGLSYYLDGE
jgi:hypothetical protein